jgi:hypothetical protein
MAPGKYPGSAWLKSCEAANFIAPHEAYLLKIGYVIRSNSTALALCSIILLVCALMTTMVLSFAWSTVSSYLKHTALASSGSVKQLRRDLRDDIVYKEASDMDPDLPPEAESTAVKRKLKEISARYGSYNKAISDFLTAKGRPVDDVIDKEIVSRAGDDYDYSKIDNMHSEVLYP